MPIGRLKSFDTDRGFGFIRQDEGGDIFMHVTARKTASIHTP